MIGALPPSRPGKQSWEICRWATPGAREDEQKTGRGAAEHGGEWMARILKGVSDVSFSQVQYICNQLDPVGQ